MLSDIASSRHLDVRFLGGFSLERRRNPVPFFNSKSTVSFTQLFAHNQRDSFSLAQTDIAQLYR